MPEILPTVQLSQEAPRRRAEQIGPGPGAFVGKGLEQLGAYGSHFAALQQEAQRRIKDGEDAVKGTEAISNLAIQIEEAERYARENAEPENHLQTWREQIAEAKAQTEAGFSGFSREKQVQYRQALARVMASAEQQVAKTANERRLDRQVANGAASIDRLTDFATRSDNKELRLTLLEQAAAVASELERTGAIKESTSTQWMEKARDKVAKGRIAYYSTGLKQELDNLQNEAFRNPAKAEDLLNRGVRKIKDAGADWLPPDKIDGTVSEFRNALYVGVIKSSIDENPQRTKAELKAGKYDDKVNQQAIIALNSEADTEIDRRQRKLEAERKEGLRLVGKEVDDFKGAVMNGFPWSGNVGALQAKVRGTEHEREFAETVRDAAELSIFSQMGPLQQEQYLRRTAQLAKSGSEAQLYKKLESAHSTTKEALAKDPISFAIRQRVIPPLVPFDLNNPDSLRERSMAAGIVEQRYGVPVSPLSDDEAAALTKQLSSAPADQQALMMRRLNENFNPRQVQSLAAGIDKKGAGEMAQAFGMSGQVPEVSSRILQGMETKRTNKDVLPSGADMTTMDQQINKKLADVYKADPNALDSVRDAIKSYYAWGRWQVGDLSGKFDSKAVDRAIYAVTGGVVDFNGSATLPPRYGATETQMREQIKAADFSNVMGDIKADTILRHGKLTAVGPGLYRVTIGGAPVFDKNGKPFNLDLNVKPVY